MKTYYYKLFLAFLSVTAISACTEDEGTEPGNDPNPIITIYQYTPSKPYNVDNDIVLRFAANNKTSDAYYLAEKTADKDAYIASNGEKSYMDYVISNGTKLSGISGESNIDITLTDLYGAYTITAVAVGKDSKTSSEATFTGLDWTNVANGTYYFFNSDNIGTISNPTVLQVCTTDPNLYRFKDVFGTGYHLKINLIDYNNSDDGGKYQFFRVPATETSFTYGDYGTVSVRDIGYWQGNDDYVTSGGYESGMYSNHNCFLFIQYYVSGKNLGYGYDHFVVN